MTGMTRYALAAGAGALTLATLGLAAGAALATTTPTRDADRVARGLVEAAPPGSVAGASFSQIPPEGNPAGASDSELTAFPLHGEEFAILGTGDVGGVENPDDSGSTSTDNGGGGGGHGAAFDLVQLRVDLDVPADRNCLTFNLRFLSEEFPEFLGSDFNDGFVAEIDTTDFRVQQDGDVTAPNNIAADENGKVVTVNTTGTSADNAIGTMFDGATPILTASTPITAGLHALYLATYDASDALYDSAVFLDNLRLRSVPADKCKRGASPTPDAGTRCQGEEATVVASDGVAVGTDARDVIVGTSDDDLIRGKGGDDLICGKGGDDEIYGGPGDDVIVGNRGDDQIHGNKGNDEIRGNRDDDQIRGNAGADAISGGPGNDVMRGNRGNDDVRGHRGDDEVNGNKGDDVLHGNRGDDVCRGGPGDDRLGRGC